MQNADFDHATEYLSKAAELESKDARVHLYYAMLLNMQGHKNAAGAAELKKELATAIALDPKLAEAYSLLGYTQAVSGEPETGLATMKKAVELAPRNENYQFNLANVYMLNSKADDAIAILRALTGSGNQLIAMRANQQLEQAVDLKQHLKNGGSRIVMNTDGATQNSSSRLVEQQVVAAIPASTPLRFLKGKLTAIDCSQSPQAVLTVAAGAKSLRVHIRDREHVILIGADQFSCEWKNRNIAVNYRDRPDGDGDVSTLEVQ
jgi:tetratricopeptide (TPR) repeat protein